MSNLHLRLLGAAQLHSDDGSLIPLGGRRRTVALLALAAAGGQFGISRDKAIALLWPDDDQDRGRNSLRQRLFMARRAIDARPLLRQDPESVRIDAEHVQVDLWAFQAAVADGRYELAATLYQGPFLDGFFVSGLGEFDRWMESQRGQLHEMALRATEQVARACARAGDHSGAVTWWRRIAHLEPLSSRFALSLVQALVASADRPAALQHARQHASAVRRELDSDPDPSFSAFVRDLEDASRGRAPHAVRRATR